jgi:hypothetical protein
MRVRIAVVIIVVVEMLLAGFGPIGLASTAAAAERETRAAQTPSASSVPNAATWGEKNFVDDRARVKDFVNALLTAEPPPSDGATAKVPPPAPAAAK